VNRKGHTRIAGELAFYANQIKPLGSNVKRAENVVEFKMSTAVNE
jgi:hypothetical protein